MSLKSRMTNVIYSSAYPRQRAKARIQKFDRVRGRGGDPVKQKRRASPGIFHGLDSHLRGNGRRGISALKSKILVLTTLLVTPVLAQPQPAENPIPDSGGAIVMGEPAESKKAAPGLPYSPVVEANGVLYLAGKIGRDPLTRELPGNITDETANTLGMIKTELEKTGASMRDVVRCQVFLADIDDFGAMNEVYRTFFPVNPPARTTVAVKDIVLNAKIEIECTAVRGHGNPDTE